LTARHRFGIKNIPYVLNQTGWMPMSRLCLLTPIVLLSFVLPSIVLAEDITHQWHHWRGPSENGIAPHATPPLKWDRNTNVRWKVPVAGNGTSTPIIWGDKLFLLTDINTGEVDPSLPKPEDQPERVFGIKFPNTKYQFDVICLNRNSGKELWRKTVHKAIPHEGHHKHNSFASASPTTNGTHLYCWFGSHGLYCLDLEGNLVWERDFGKLKMPASLGEGTSPVLHGNRLIINRDSAGKSYVLCLDASNGETIWRKERDEVATWVTPLVVEAAGKTQVIIPASNRIRSYNLDNGDVIWECGGQVRNVTPSPVIIDGHVICMSGYRGSTVMSIALDSEGDVTDSDKILWERHRDTPYIPSPILNQGLLFYTKSNSGILTCVEATTGKVLMEPKRMDGIQNMYASPVGTHDRIYFTGREGSTLVIANSPDYKVLAVNKLEEIIDASPAIVGDAIYIRTRKHLYCIGE